jgi:dTDP-4-amino-4,6-dideoxygalactose transaminase
MKRIPFFKQSLINVEHSGAAIAAITAMTEGRSPLVMGKYTRAFEHEFAGFLGCKNFIYVSSGLDALVLALKALGIGPGDEVIVPTHTYIATWLAPLSLGCSLVACPVKDSNLLLDESQIPRLLSSRTRCIMPVHLYGNACNMVEIMRIAVANQLSVVEDAAQAHGAIEPTSGLHIGLHGDAVAFSFYPTKNLGAMGEGGGIACRSPELADRIRSLRNYGRNPHDGAINDLAGMNARGDEVQAAVLSSKLRKLDQINEQRKHLIILYQQNLKNQSLPAKLISYNAKFAAPHLAVLRCENPADRDSLMQYLKDQGIETAVHYRIPCHKQPCMMTSQRNIFLCSFAANQAQQIARSIISLPMSECHTENEVINVSEAIKKFFKY